MTRRSQLGGQTSVTSMIRDGGVINASAALTFAAANANALTALSGAMTANTLKTAYSATGKGRVNLFAVGTNDATSRAVRIKVTVNGSSVVFDKTSTALTAAGAMVTAIGSTQTGTTWYPVVFQPIDYTNGILIEFASSLTETDKLTTAINAEVRQ